MKKNTVTLDDYLKERLKDPEFKAEFEKERERLQKQLDEKIQSGEITLDMLGGTDDEMAD